MVLLSNQLGQLDINANYMEENFSKLNELVAKHIAKLYVYAAGLCTSKDPFTSKELVSELVIRAYDKLPLILEQPEETRFFYLLVMMKHLYWGMKKKRKTFLELVAKTPFKDRCESDERMLIERDSMAHIEKQIAVLLDEKQVQIVMMRLKGYSFKEIAEKLEGSVTEANAKVIHGRAIKRLAKKLNPLKFLASL